MRAVVLLAALLAACTSCASGPIPQVAVTVQPVGTGDTGVQTALRFTELASDLGCTVVHVGGGVVVTAKHCVEDMAPGAETSQGMLVYQDEVLDFALLYDLSSAADMWPVLRAPRLGEHVYVVGYPVQLSTETQELTITDGLFAGPGDGLGNLRITAPVYFGNSGGGCWGEDGALIGLTVNGYLELPGMNYIVPADRIALSLPKH